jgi:hypothetical protein
MTATEQTDLDRLITAMAECRELVRDAHAATKDLRTAIREAKTETAGLAASEVDGRVRAEIDAELARLDGATSAAITAAADEVASRFDAFGESLLGKETYWLTAAGRRAQARPDDRPMSAGPDSLRP